jgi:membrane protease YdiL (CAAX protease family)
LTGFFLLAFAISWAIMIPLALSAQGIIEAKVPLQLHYLTAYGPMLAALLVTGVADRGPGLRSLGASMIKWRVGASWFVVAALSPAILFAVGALAGRIWTGAWPALRDLGQVNFLPYLGLWALPFWIVTSGFGEEVGWRGYALPRLQRGRTALSATLILWVFWVTWHIPAFFYLPNYREIGLWFFPGFALGVFAGAIIYTWLFNGTGGSVPMAALFHGVFNFFTASAAGQGIAAMVASILVIVWGFVLLLTMHHSTLSPSNKVTL